MISGINFPFRNRIHVLIICVIASFLLVACGGKASPTVEVAPPASQDQAPTQAFQPAQPELVEDSPAPTQAQVVEPTKIKSPAKAINTCALVTKAEAENAFGASLGDPVQEDLPPMYSCRYKTPDLNYVGISLVDFEDSQTAADAFQWEIDINHYEEVNGIGDRALKPELYDISVLKGQYELSINIVNDADEGTRYEKSKELAMLALGRLP